MANRFVHFNTKSAFNTATLGTEYDNNSIVFIKDSQEIWTHGTFYSIPDSYKNKITNLETAVAALQEAYAFKSVKVGDTTVTAANGKETLTFAGGANTSVTLDNTTRTITIGSTLGANAYYPNSSGETLATQVANLESSVAKTVNGTDAINVTSSGNTRTVALKLNNGENNVTLSQNADGLSAQITNVNGLVPVDGVAASDKILTLTNKKIGATLNLTLDNTAGSDGKKYIRLTGANNAELGKIDIAEFVKDGMLDSASFDQSSHELTLAFNTASGKEAIHVDLSSLVDVYDGSKVKLKGVAIPETSSEPAANDTVDSAISNLIAKDRELQSDIEAINNNIQDLTDGGLSSITKGTDGDFVTTTVTSKVNNTQSVGVSVDTSVAPENASESSNSLTTSYAVKQYVEKMFKWGEY